MIGENNFLINHEIFTQFGCTEDSIRKALMLNNHNVTTDGCRIIVQLEKVEL